MAGKPKAKRSKVRERIIREATDLAMVQGFEALTIGHLCEVSAMPPSQVRYHFSNTGHLLFHLADQAWLELLNSLEMPPDTPPEDGLYFVARVYATGRAAGLGRHLSHVPVNLLQPRQRSVLRYKHRLVLQTFQEAVRACRPALPSDGIMVLSLSLMALLDGYAAWSREPGAMDPAAYADLAHRMVLVDQPRNAT